MSDLKSIHRWMVVAAIIIVLGVIGEVKCIIKTFQCNWEPIGKAEIFYTVGTFTGAGCVIGWFDIKDY